MNFGYSNLFAADRNGVASFVPGRQRGASSRTSPACLILSDDLLAGLRRAFGVAAQPAVVVDGVSPRR